MKIGKFNLHEFRGWKAVCAAFLFCAVATIASSAQTFNVLTNFDGTNGGNPYGSLVQGQDGNFYGTTNVTGPTDYGTAFKITSAGQLTTLYGFCSQRQCADGGEPRAGLIQGTDGLFYGTTTTGGGQIGHGTLFGMTSTGTLSGAYDFGADNFPSNAALVQSPGGGLYGVTAEHVFKITTTGKLTTLYTFTNGTSPGNGLMQASNGNFYITTYYGGAHSSGAIYKMTPAGNVTTLYSFCPSNCDDDNGIAPDATMVEGNDGSLYGTTSQGGTNGGGTVFKIALGKITALYNFCSQTGCADGSYPLGLVQGSDGNFYGVTYYGGNNGGYLSGEGTLYKITPAGQLTTLYRFCSRTNCADGSGPLAALMQGTDGNFYGTTLDGGSNASACPPFVFTGPCGTVFSLSTGLGPFVKLTQNFGSVGHTGGILGQGFTGTTGVFLNGTPASFTVISDTFIQATVPAGATSGFVTVNTPSGTLTSNVPFHVKP